ncbi:hypothetical protein N7493_005022 [Penicillium malachiteum]|uniref:Uncharacterized protein n=1 Tax=Penicillium malachiteum TaxID=1324776 RepID=A0AAD6HLY2_9EURO|nr:hypothetical protein N7493_005022 [Penicillium malachiteum]
MAHAEAQMAFSQEEYFPRKHDLRKVTQAQSNDIVFNADQHHREREPKREVDQQSPTKSFHKRDEETEIAEMCMDDTQSRCSKS